MGFEKELSWVGFDQRLKRCCPGWDLIREEKVLPWVGFDQRRKGAGWDLIRDLKGAALGGI